MIRKTRGRAATALLTMLTLVASLVLLVAPVAAQDEGCPDPTSLLVSFAVSGSTFTPDGGDAMGVSLSGDADLAYWSSAQVISALVVTAGGASYNLALDFPETTGSVSPHNYAVFGGASMDGLAFCTGEKTDPDTTTNGVSITLSKTAECATLGDDGMATVTGTVTAEADSRDASARITTAVDTILGPGGVALQRASIDALVGQVLVPGAGSATVNYDITFDPGDAEAFENFIEVTIEDADTGEDRNKVYNARASFVLCEVPEVPPTEPEEPGPVQEEPPREDEEGGRGTPAPSAGELPDTATDAPIVSSAAAILALLMLGSMGALGYMQLQARRRS